MPRSFIVALVAARVLCAQKESSALLERARDKIIQSARRLPKYTCLQNIDRTYYAPPPPKRSQHSMSEAPGPASTCSENLSASRSPLEAKDRLRIEVAVAGDHEIESWPGATSPARRGRRRFVDAVKAKSKVYSLRGSLLLLAELWELNRARYSCLRVEIKRSANLLRQNANDPQA